MFIKFVNDDARRASHRSLQFQHTVTQLFLIFGVIFVYRSNRPYYFFFRYNIYVLFSACLKFVHAEKRGAPIEKE